MTNIPVLFEDDDLIIVNKPVGLLVHKTNIDKHESTSLLQQLRVQTGIFLYALHRLDKPTSGVIALTKSAEFAAQMQATLQQSASRKQYVLVCRGFVSERGVIDHPLKPVADFKHQRRSVNFAQKPAQNAATKFECLAQYTLDAEIDRYPQSRFSLVKAELLTGRKHQLRRHFKHISHPIIGCPKYGKSKYNDYFEEEFGVGRLMLHAYRLEFLHPKSNLKINVTAEPDEDFLSILERFDWGSRLR